MTASASTPRSLLPLLLLCLLLAACTSPPAPPELPDAGALEGLDVATLLARADGHWQWRDEAAELARALDLYAQALSLEPGRSDLMVRLSRGEFLAGQLLAEDDDERLEHWRRGQAWGEAALATDAEYAAAAEAHGADSAEALAVLDVEQVPALYWTALNLTSWATNSGMLAAATNMGRFRALMERVGQLDPEHDDGGVEHFRGVDRASAPALAGGDQQAADGHFRAAIASAPWRGRNRLLYVERLLLPQERLDEARDQLLAVLAMDPEEHPALVPEQRQAQARAAELLAELDSGGG